MIAYRVVKKDEYDSYNIKEKIYHFPTSEYNNGDNTFNYVEGEKYCHFFLIQ